jgi:mRNA interferase RelE/StbE
VSYTLLLDRAAEKELRTLPAQILKRIDKRLLALSDQPKPKGSLKLKGKEGEGWRIRIGDYRILYTIEESQKIIRIYRISHRREAYR